MPITAASDGHGSTMTFSGFTYNIIGVDWSGTKRDAIESTHMGTTVSKDYIPSDLVEPGDVTFEIEFDPQAVPPITAAKGTLVIVWGSLATLKTWTWTNAAFLTDFKGGAKSGDRMTGSATFKLTALPVVS